MKTAIIFEGGGMRGAYTAAVVRTLIENDLDADFATGISAGASNLINFVSRDPDRARRTFVDFASDPNMGNVKTWLRGEGYFNSHYIYRQTAGPGQALPLDWDTFQANPIEYAIGGFDINAGRGHYWGKSDIASLDELTVRVQASSTLPGIMPFVDMEGTKWADGALGSSGGIALDAARAAGCDRFFVVLSRTRDYWKPEVRRPGLIKAHFRAYPKLAQAIIDRPRRYNAAKRELLQLEAEGRAYLFIPERMEISINERRVDRLAEAFDVGLDQSRRELGAWKEFLAPQSGH